MRIGTILFNESDGPLIKRPRLGNTALEPKLIAIEIQRFGQPKMVSLVCFTDRDRSLDQSARHRVIALLLEQPHQTLQRGRQSLMRGAERRFLDTARAIERLPCVRVTTVDRE